MTAPTPKVAIIIVNYKGREDTLECLASLRGLTYPAFSVYVVDQASEDGTPEAVRQAFPDVTVIENPENNGFAGGNNTGIRAALEAGAAYVYLLNNDTVVAPNLLEPLVELAESDPDIAVVGSLMLYHSDPAIIWSAGGQIGPNGESIMQAQGENADTIGPEPFDVDFVVGCGLLTGRGALRKLGLLDDSYFLYYEETDFCARARHNGWRNVSCPASRLWHKVSRTTGKDSDLTFYYMRRNVLRYLSRYADNPKRRVQNVLLGTLRLALVLAARGQFKRSLVALRAVRDYQNGKFGKARFVL